MGTIIGLLGRFVPGLLPAIGGFLNPWILLAIGGAITGAFLYGMHVRGEMAGAFEQQVGKVGELQEQRTRDRIVRDQRLKKEIDDANAADLAVLGTSIAALVNQLSVDPGGSVLPSVPAGTAMPQTIRFDFAELDRALQDSDREVRAILKEAAGLVGEGARYGVDLACGARWVREQERESGLNR
jgi:hypothetical protein